jgi:hypothetical protein
VKFWLGLHMPGHMERVSVPVCVSYGRLRGRKKLPEASGDVFLDSRGFSEIFQHGRYTFTAQTYVDFVRRCRDKWGERLCHTSIMDWMCEPIMNAKTRKTVGQHQQLTVNSWISLNALDGSLPWVPVIQGFAVEDYHRCVDLYWSHAATRLERLPLVGVGSVCRRQGMQEAAVIIQSLHARGLRNLHGFGFKITGLVSQGLRLARYLASSDSMAWSTRARSEWAHERRRLCGGEHKSGCANCLAWAMKWRDKLMRRVEAVTTNGTQFLLF